MLCGVLEGLTMNKGERILSLAVLSFGIIFTIVSLRLPRAPVGDPMGPIYFPLGLGMLMSIIGFLMLISRKSEETNHSSRKLSKKALYTILLTVALGIMYAFIFNRLGFAVSTLIFLGTLLFIINGPKKWLTNISATVLFTVGIWYLFEKIFLITLP